MVSRTQLAEVGLGPGAIRHRARSGGLHPLHRGVYAVGHRRLTFRAHLWAAVLACGGPEAAVLSHRAAAALWDLMPVPSGAIDVTTLRESRSTSAIRVHRPRLPPDPQTLDGLPVTTVARTLRDLAPVLSTHRLERLCHRAEHLLDAAAPELGRGPKLRSALATLAARAPDVTRSELEERFLALVAGAGLPRPEVNVRVAGHEVDFLWRARRLVVETDGAATHLNASAFERDRRRNAELGVTGLRVVRFTWRALADDPQRVLATMRSLLGSYGAPPRG